jgi:hypothetical protein
MSYLAFTCCARDPTFNHARGSQRWWINLAFAATCRARASSPRHARGSERQAFHLALRLHYCETAGLWDGSLGGQTPVSYASCRNVLRIKEPTSDGGKTWGLTTEYSLLYEIEFQYRVLSGVVIAVMVVLLWQFIIRFIKNPPVKVDNKSIMGPIVGQYFGNSRSCGTLKKQCKVLVPCSVLST